MKIIFRDDWPLRLGEAKAKRQRGALAMAITAGIGKLFGAVV
jgi:hypothetical protein